MKTFHVGDGEKTIQCDDAFECDGADGDTLAFTKAAHPDVTIRVSVLSVTFKPGTPADRLRVGLREKAQKAECTPVELKDITYFIGNPEMNDEGYKVRFAYAVVENHHAIFSLTLPANSDCEALFLADLRSMIKSLRIRKAGEMSHADFTIAHQKGLQEALQWLGEASIATEPAFDLGEALQNAVYAVLDGRAEQSRTGSIGLGFGELLKRAVPGLQWKILMDDGGSIHCLRYLNSSVTIFPTAMAWKRIERKEAFDVKDLMEGTIDAVESAFRNAT